MEFKQARKQLGYLKSVLGKTDIYTNIFLDGEFAHATNGITGMKVPFETKFQAIVAGKKFIDTLDHCIDWPTMKLTNNNLIVKEKNFRVLVPIIVDKEFPTFEDDIEAPGVAIGNSDEFVTTLNKVKPYAATDFVKGAMTCIAFREGFIYAVDNKHSVRQALDTVGIDGLLLPAPLIDIMSKIEPLLNIQHTDNAIYITNDEGCIVKSAVIAGDFPNVEAIWPTIDPNDLHNMTEPIRDAVKKISKLSDNNTCVFKGDAISSGDDAVSITGLDYNFDTCTLTADTLAKAIDDVTHFALSEDASKPALFTNDNGFELLLMPHVQ